MIERFVADMEPEAPRMLCIQTSVARETSAPSVDSRMLVWISILEHLLTHLAGDCEPCSVDLHTRYASMLKETNSIAAEANANGPAGSWL
jgi:hypothetical protein